MDDLTKKKIVDLYNDAVLKIFPIGTMLAIFGSKKTMDEESNNKMTLPINQTSVQEKNEKKSKFLEFMEKNFTDISGTGVDNTAKLIDVNENVKEFIERMEVKLFKGKSFITILATLHDIIDKLTSTDYNSVHCLSEKVFMAILLAIQMLHYPTPINEYQLTFQFSKSLFGKSGLEKSSTICSRNKSFSSSDDPVAKNIFHLNLDALKQKQAPEAAPAGEEQLSTNLEPEAAEEQPTPLTGDELYEKCEKKLPLSDDIKTNADIQKYRKYVLDNFNQSTNDNVNLNLDEICSLLLISCNGLPIERYSKLLFFKEIFASEYCIEISQSEKCHKIFMNVAEVIQKEQDELFKKSNFSTRGGNKSRRKPVRKTRRGRGRTRKSKSKSKSKTHRHRRHSRVRKHKKYTSRRR